MACVKWLFVIVLCFSLTQAKEDYSTWTGNERPVLTREEKIRISEAVELKKKQKLKQQSQKNKLKLQKLENLQTGITVLPRTKKRLKQEETSNAEVNTKDSVSVSGEQRLRDIVVKFVVMISSLVVVLCVFIGVKKRNGRGK